MPGSNNPHIGWPLGMRGGGSVIKATYQVAFAFNLYHITKHLVLYISPGPMTVDVGGGRLFWGSIRSSSSRSSSNSRSSGSTSGRRQ